MASILTGTSGQTSENDKNMNYGTALSVLTTLFFMWGFMTCLNDILIPHLKSLFDMDYTKTMLIQFTFFGTYALMSIPSSVIIGKIGYKNGIVMGLSIAALGAFMFYPASEIIYYPLFLFAFFVLATGITVLQVAANPYVAILGKPETASSRLTMTQAFNSLGTTIAPILGAFFILGGTFYNSTGTNSVLIKPTNIQIEAIDNATWKNVVDKNQILTENVSAVFIDKADNIWFETENKIIKYSKDKREIFNSAKDNFTANMKGIVVNESKQENTSNTVEIITAEAFDEFMNNKAKTVQKPYIGIGIVLLLIALGFLFAKLPVISTARPDKKTQGNALQYKHLVFGAIGIFVYVGAEVSIGSFLVNFFGETNIAGLIESEAAKYVALYWGGAMIGRFQGAIAMSALKNKLYRSALMGIILIFGYFLALYITADSLQSLYFSIFVIINIIACLLGKNNPARTLSVFSAIVVLLVLSTIIFDGKIAMWTIIAVGLFNSIMFPTIFTLAIDGLGKHTAQASGILNTAIVGGAFIPLLMGFFADQIGIHYSFAITLVCYLYILFYGLKGHKHGLEKADSLIKS